MYIGGRPERERERERFSHPITQHTRDLLRHVDLLKFYEEDTSLRGKSTFLQQYICHWDHAQQAFRIGPDSWYLPMDEDIHFVIGLSRKGEDWSQFPELVVNIATKMKLIYVQRYFILDIVDPTNFQVVGG